MLDVDNLTPQAPSPQGEGEPLSNSPHKGEGNLAAYNLRRWGLPTDEKFYKENGIYFVAVTPSGHGLRVIGERLHGETIEAGQERLARMIGVIVISLSLP